MTPFKRKLPTLHLHSQVYSVASDSLLILCCLPACLLACYCNLFFSASNDANTSTGAEVMRWAEAQMLVGLSVGSRQHPFPLSELPGDKACLQPSNNQHSRGPNPPTATVVYYCLFAAPAHYITSKEGHNRHSIYVGYSRFRFKIRRFIVICIVKHVVILYI